MRDILRLIFRNTLRHKQRTFLTVLGVAIALLSFCMIRTIVEAWYSGVNSSAKNRLVTRNQISLVFSLPLSYREKIAQISGVELVGYGSWFGGTYKDEKNRFAQFAVDLNYLDIYPEYVLSPDERQNFTRDKRGALVGEQIAQKFGLKVGDNFQLIGTLYPGNWDFVISGILRGREESNSTRLVLFRWDYLNERNKLNPSRPPDQVGYYVMRIANGTDPALVSREIDTQFKNSFAETLTETETAFQQSFVSMSSTIIAAMNTISVIVIVIILLVMANTMLMSTRERIREFAILKSIGFGTWHLALVMIGESILISLFGFVFLCLLLVPVFNMFANLVLSELAGFFPTFKFHYLSLLYAFLIALTVGALASLWPFLRIQKLRVAEGLRTIE